LVSFGGDSVLKLNEDFSDIERQIKVLDDYFHRTSKKDNIMACYQTYYSLIFFDKLCTYKLNEGLSFRGKDYIANIVAERSNQLKNKFMDNFLKNKEFHAEMLATNFVEIGDILTDYCTSPEYTKLYGVYNKPIDAKHNEDFDLLVNFFKDVNPDLNDLFLDMVEHKRFYKLDPLFIEHSGLTVLNPIEKICNVFIDEKLPSVSYLGTFVHEMGHVYDDTDYANRFSVKESMKYMHENFYIEVLSTYYEQRFYEWLVDNNIRKEESKLCFFNYLNSYLDSVGDAILFSMIPDDYHNAAVAGYFNREELINIIDVEGELIDEFDNTVDTFIPEFDDSFNYGYGIMIANALMHDDKLFDDFLKVRNGIFNKDKLLNIGITPEETGKKLVKNIEWFINK